MSFQILSYDNQPVKYNVPFLLLLLLLLLLPCSFAKKKKWQRVSDKTAPKWRKGREVHLGLGRGIFVKKNLALPLPGID